MSVLPNSIDDRIKFCENHLTVFGASATQLGTTAAAVTAMGVKTAAARAALQAQGEKHDQAKSATAELHLAVEAMTDAVADILKQIKTQAAIVGQSIYVLADIPVPAQPSPRPAPGTPSGLVVMLLPAGALKLSWKCPNPAGAGGTIYQIGRRTGGGSFEFVGSTGSRSFIDDTLAAGSATVTYQIQAVRSTVRGTAAQFVVNFGVSGGGDDGVGVAAEDGGVRGIVASGQWSERTLTPLTTGH